MNVGHLIRHDSRVSADQSQAEPPVSAAVAHQNQHLEAVLKYDLRMHHTRVRIGKSITGSRMAGYRQPTTDNRFL